MATSCVRIVRGTGKFLSRLNTRGVNSHRWVQHLASYQDTLHAHGETQITSLGNQLRVATEETYDSVATVGVWLHGGTRYETEKTNGVAHFVEHLAFKGTGKRSQMDLEAEVEGLGMQLSSYTDKEHMAVYAKCLAKDVPKAVEILGDICQSNAPTDDAINRQRKVVMGELQAAETNLKTVVMDYLHATAYQGTTLALSKYGTTQSLKSLTRDDLTHFKSTYFKPPRMVLAASGGVHHKQLVELGEKHFSGLSLSYDKEIPVLTPSRYTGSEIRARYDDLPLAHAAIAIEGADVASADYIPMLVASAVIGCWDKTYGAGANLSNRLGSMNAQVPMCHSFESFYKTYSDTALWGVYFAAEMEQIPDLMFNIQGEWMRLCSSVTEFEVERAKKQLKTRLLQECDETTHAADAIGREVLQYNRHLPRYEIDARIESVSGQTVRDVCMKYIYDRCPAVAAIGPLECFPDYNRIRGSMYWLRL